MVEGTVQRRPDAPAARQRSVRRWLREHRYRFADWFYACLFFPWTAVFNLAPTDGTGNRLWDWAATIGFYVEIPVVLMLLFGIPGLVSLAILGRRKRPHLLLFAAAAVLFVFANPVPTTIALYSYAVWFTDRRRLAVWSGVLTAGVVINVLKIFADVPTTVTVVNIVFQCTFAIALPLTVGLWAGTRRELIANLKERAERLEREQYLMAEHAISAERTRIAREMHDVVAHRVSLMVLHAGGLEVSAADTATVETAGLIRSTGREALAELREILGVLRDAPDTDAPTTPQPVLADLARLIGDWRSAGMPVQWRTTGTPRALSAQLERTAYRTVQEALTNAGRHAPGCPVVVRLDYGERDLEIAVTNEPPRDDAKPRPQPPPGSGYGLAGLRERIALAGGTLSAGPYPDGGWQVRAIVPVAQETEEEGERSGDPHDSGR